MSVGTLLCAARRRAALIGFDPVVWNSADKGSGITLSTGAYADDRADGGAGSWHTVRATKSLSGSVKAYWEIELIAWAAEKYYFGIADSSMSLTSILGFSANSAGVRGNAPNYFESGWSEANTPTGVSEAVGGVVKCAFDAGSGKFWVGLDGTATTGWWVGDPASGASPYVGDATGGGVFPAFTSETSAVKGQLRSKASDFTLGIPSGFSALAEVAT